MKIIRLTNKDKNFYSTLGQFLARRDVDNEIGYRIYDDDGKVWIIALEMKKAVGFCYLWQKTKSHYQIGSCYVVERYRQKGIFRKLFNNAIKDIKGVVTMTTKNKYLIEMLTNEGFLEGKQRGSFIEYVKEYGINESKSETV
jgi:GNAT superfamily N-acetyltransferase